MLEMTFLLLLKLNILLGMVIRGEWLILRLDTSGSLLFVNIVVFGHAFDDCQVRPLSSEKLRLEREGMKRILLLVLKLTRLTMMVFKLWRKRIEF